MRKLFFFGLLALSVFLFPKCLDNESYTKYDLWLNITDYYAEDTATVNTPCNVHLYTTSDNSCVSNLRFLISQYDDFTYRFFAKATFVNHGESCFLFNRYADSIYTFTPTQTGKYYFEFYSIDSLNPIKDSVIIIE